MKVLARLTLLLCAAAACAAEPDVPAGRPVAVRDGEWTDAARGRTIPYRVYAPQDATGRCPVIVFSHGLGGTREGYRYLGEAWAAHGYLAIHLQHHGSDDAVWRGVAAPREAMRRAVLDYRNALDRTLDVRFALDQLARDPLLAPRADTNRAGIAGHSFGAWTTLAAAGEALGPAGDRFADPRLKAGIAMSAPAPRRRTPEVFDAVRMPLLHMTGTADDSPIGDTRAAERRVPYDLIAAPHQYLVTFQGGDHMIFSGRPRAVADPRDARFQQQIVRVTTAFWDAWLRGDAEARAWLDGGGCAAALGEIAAFERK